MRSMPLASLAATWLRSTTAPLVLSRISPEATLPVSVLLYVAAAVGEPVDDAPEPVVGSDAATDRDLLAERDVDAGPDVADRGHAVELDVGGAGDRGPVEVGDRGEPFEPRAVGLEEDDAEDELAERAAT